MMRVLAGYTLDQKLHASEHTTVYRGHRLADGMPVVIKLLSREYPAPRELGKLRHEFELLRELDLPGIARAYALEVCGNGLALILESLPGRPLSECLEAGPLPLTTALRTAAALSGIIDAIHRRQIIHKDIKPQNILLDSLTGAVYLLDFGIATRLSQETQRAIRPDDLEGTLAYVSPEQTGRMNRRLDRRSDLYSLGVSLYEMLTGALPFAQEDPLQLIHCHIARTPPEPHVRAPSVPLVVSDLCMRLLSKNAEDRYQSAQGVQADLEEACTRLDSRGSVEPFPLGEHDFAYDLQIPQRLYGRESAVAELLAAFDRASQGAVELLLVSGYSGVGKSVLVAEVNRGIAQRGGYFIAGKFDPLSRGVPYESVARAFSELIRQLLGEPRHVLLRWRQQLLAAVGVNGRLLIDLIAELELIIGPQPPVAALGASEAQNRFSLLFQNFLRVIATAEHPLILFLDDLQWADSASLRLLQILLSDPQSSHLLLIGAYRENEIDSLHRLPLALAEIRRSGATINTLTLLPLGLPEVTALIADAVKADAGQVAPLAELAFGKTQGNPFFLSQFLLELYRNGLLYFDSEKKAWQWSLPGIAAAAITDNVADFMAGKLLRLRESTREALTLAACLGSTFELKTLGRIAERPDDALAHELWPALREGLVVPLDSAYLYLSQRPSGSEPSAAPLSAEDLDVKYKFLHDRVRQAAYDLASESQRQTIHLRIGRHLHKRGYGEGNSEELFSLVMHMNLGSALLATAAERSELGRYNLLAGVRAKAATAYQGAAGYLGAGIALLGPDGFSCEYALCFDLHVELAECEYLNGNFERTELLFETLLRQARTSLERARINNLRMILYTTRGQFGAAITAGLAGLGEFGITLPDSEAERGAALGAELGEVDANLAGRRIADLLHAPELTDKERQATVSLFANMNAPAYMLSPALLGLVTIKQVNLLLRYGNSEVAPHTFMAYGFILSNVLGRYAEALEFGQLALNLADRFGTAGLKCKLSFIFGAYTHFCQPFAGVIDCFTRSYEAGLDSGDFLYLSYARNEALITRLGRGDELNELGDEVRRSLALIERTQVALSLSIHVLLRQVIHNFQGHTRDRLSLSDDTFDEREFLEEVDRAGLSLAGLCFYVYKAQLHYFQHDYRGALAAADAAEHWIAGSVGHFITTELSFYRCLTLLALYPAATPEEQASYREQLDRQQQSWSRWADNCPENFRHKECLLIAERKRVEGDALTATAFYDLSAKLSEEAGLVPHQGLANELAALFHLTSGQTRAASAYLSRAHHCYLRWGGGGRAADLARRHPQLLIQLQPPPAATLPPADILPTTAAKTKNPTPTRIVSSVQLDSETVLRAAQAISSELVLDKLLDRLMHILLASSGAQRGVLLLQRGSGLRVEATMQIEPDQVCVGQRVPLEEYTELPHAIVQYVERTREPLLLAHTLDDPRFASDPYIVAHKPRSTLCLALVHQGRLSGLLYLENRIALDVFTAQRVQLLELLCTQAAIAVENAILYSDLQHASAELKKVNEGLESIVAARTAALNKALSELWSEMDLATKIQTVLLPSDGRYGDYEIAATMRPAAQVGGDYYDVFPAGDRLWVLIGDVSGHGVRAGLIMMMVQMAVRTLLCQPDSGSLQPSDMLSCVNTALRSNLSRIGQDQFMTLTAVCLTQGRLTYAGLHLDPLVYRAQSQRVERLESNGVWLGVIDDARLCLSDDQAELAPDDILLLYTDGLIEATRGGDYLRIGWVEKCLLEQGRAAAACRELVDRLVAGLAGAECSDDVSVLALRRCAETTEDRMPEKRS